MKFLDGRQSKKLFENNIVISNCFIRNNFKNQEYFLRPQKLVQYRLCNICLLMMPFKKYHNNGEKVDKFGAKIIYYFHNMNGTLPL